MFFFRQTNKKFIFIHQSFKFHSSDKAVIQRHCWTTISLTNCKQNRRKTIQLLTNMRTIHDQLHRTHRRIGISFTFKNIFWNFKFFLFCLVFCLISVTRRKTRSVCQAERTARRRDALEAHQKRLFIYFFYVIHLIF